MNSSKDIKKSVSQGIKSLPKWKVFICVILSVALAFSMYNGTSIMSLINSSSSTSAEENSNIETDNTSNFSMDSVVHSAGEAALGALTSISNNVIVPTLTTVNNFINDASSNFAAAINNDYSIEVKFNEHAGMYTQTLQVVDGKIILPSPKEPAYAEDSDSIPFRTWLDNNFKEYNPGDAYEVDSKDAKISFRADYVYPNNDTSTDLNFGVAADDNSTSLVDDKIGEYYYNPLNSDEGTKVGGSTSGDGSLRSPQLRFETAINKVRALYEESGLANLKSIAFMNYFRHYNDQGAPEELKELSYDGKLDDDHNIILNWASPFKQETGLLFQLELFDNGESAGESRYEPKILNMSNFDMITKVDSGIEYGKNMIRAIGGKAVFDNVRIGGTITFELDKYFWENRTTINPITFKNVPSDAKYTFQIDPNSASEAFEYYGSDTLPIAYVDDPNASSDKFVLTYSQQKFFDLVVTNVEGTNAKQICIKEKICDDTSGDINNVYVSAETGDDDLNSGKNFLSPFKTIERALQALATVDYQTISNIVICGNESVSPKSDSTTWNFNVNGRQISLKRWDGKYYTLDISGRSTQRIWPLETIPLIKISGKSSTFYIRNGIISNTQSVDIWADGSLVNIDNTIIKDTIIRPSAEAWNLGAAIYAENASTITLTSTTRLLNNFCKSCSGVYLNGSTLAYDRDTEFTSALNPNNRNDFAENLISANNVSTINFSSNNNYPLKLDNSTTQKTYAYISICTGSNVTYNNFRVDSYLGASPVFFDVQDGNFLISNFVVNNCMNSTKFICGRNGGSSASSQNQNNIRFNGGTNTISNSNATIELGSGSYLYNNNSTTNITNYCPTGTAKNIFSLSGTSYFYWDRGRLNVKDSRFNNVWAYGDGYNGISYIRYFTATGNTVEKSIISANNFVHSGNFNFLNDTIQNNYFIKDTCKIFDINGTTGCGTFYWWDGTNLISDNYGYCDINITNESIIQLRNFQYYSNGKLDADKGITDSSACVNLYSKSGTSHLNTCIFRDNIAHKESGVIVREYAGTWEFRATQVLNNNVYDSGTDTFAGIKLVYESNNGTAFNFIDNGGQNIITDNGSSLNLETAYPVPYRAGIWYYNWNETYKSPYTCNSRSNIYDVTLNNNIGSFKQGIINDNGFFGFDGGGANNANKISHDQIIYYNSIHPTVLYTARLNGSGAAVTEEEDKWIIDYSDLDTYYKDFGRWLIDGSVANTYTYLDTFEFRGLPSGIIPEGNKANNKIFASQDAVWLDGYSGNDTVEDAGLSFIAPAKTFQKAKQVLEDKYNANPNTPLKIIILNRLLLANSTEEEWDGLIDNKRTTLLRYSRYLNELINIQANRHLTLKNVNFDTYSAKYMFDVTGGKYNGRTIFSDNAQFDIENVDFLNESGVSLYSQNGGTYPSTITNCNFTNCCDLECTIDQNAYKDNSPLWLYGNTQTYTISNCNFTNISKLYGAVYVDNSSRAYFDNCNFSNNSYFNGHGVVSSNSSAYFGLDNCNFTQNTYEANTGSIDAINNPYAGVICSMSVGQNNVPVSGKKYAYTIKNTNLYNNFKDNADANIESNQILIDDLLNNGNIPDGEIDNTGCDLIKVFNSKLCLGGEIFKLKNSYDGTLPVSDSFKSNTNIDISASHKNTALNSNPIYLNTDTSLYLSHKWKLTVKPDTSYVGNILVDGDANTLAENYMDVFVLDSSCNKFCNGLEADTTNHDIVLASKHIYLDGQKGNDDNAGNKATNAVKTWKQAKKLLATKGTGSADDPDGTCIIICGTINTSTDFGDGTTSPEFNLLKYDSATDSYYYDENNKTWVPKVKIDTAYFNLNNYGAFLLTNSTKVDFNNIIFDGQYSSKVNYGFYYGNTNGTVDVNFNRCQFQKFNVRVLSFAGKRTVCSTKADCTCHLSLSYSKIYDCGKSDISRNSSLDEIIHTENAFALDFDHVDFSNNYVRNTVVQRGNNYGTWARYDYCNFYNSHGPVYIDNGANYDYTTEEVSLSVTNCNFTIDVPDLSYYTSNYNFNTSCVCFTNVRDFVCDNCNFNGCPNFTSANYYICQGHGGYANIRSATVTNCYFKNCESNCCSVVHFTVNKHVGEFNFDNLTFENCYHLTETTWSYTNCSSVLSVSKNQDEAEHRVCKVNITNCNFFKNSEGDYTRGGAIYARYTTLFIDEVEISGCTNSLSALRTESGCNLTVTKNVHIHDVGSAIYMRFNAPPVLKEGQSSEDTPSWDVLYEGNMERCLTAPRTDMNKNPLLGSEPYIWCFAATFGYTTNVVFNNVTIKDSGYLNYDSWRNITNAIYNNNVDFTANNCVWYNVKGKGFFDLHGGGNEDTHINFNLNNCKFEWCSFAAWVRGMFVCFDGYYLNLNMYGCTFLNCKLFPKEWADSNSGVISNNGGNHQYINIDNCDFNRVAFNYTDPHCSLQWTNYFGFIYNRGGIYGTTVTNSHFDRVGGIREEHASIGHVAMCNAIYYDAYDFKDATFSGNTFDNMWSEGSQFYFENAKETTNINITNNKFNHFYHSGSGFIQVKGNWNGGNLNLTDNTFYDLFSTGNSNVLNVDQSSNANINFYGENTFNECHSNGSGLIFTNGTNNTINLFDKTTFNNCYLTGGGGVICTTNNSAKTDVINVTDNCLFNECRANGTGGAILVQCETVNVSGNVQFLNCSAGNGGAFGTNNTFGFLNLSGNVKVSGCHATNNGGAMYTGNGNVDIAGSTEISGNYVDNANGGAIYATSNTLLYIHGSSQISGNTAKQQGGAVWTNSNAYLKLYEDAIISENEAGTEGGAFYFNKGNDNRDFVDLAGGYVLGNHAVSSGGAMYINTCVNFNGVTVKDNYTGSDPNVQLPNTDDIFVARTIYLYSNLSEITDPFFFNNKNYHIVQMMAFQGSNKIKVRVNPAQYTKDSILVSPDGEGLDSAEPYISYYSLDNPTYILVGKDKNIVLGPSVFVDGQRGRDSNNGLRPNSCFQTISRALTYLGNSPGVIYVVGTITYSGNQELMLNYGQSIARYNGFPVEGTDYSSYAFKGDIIDVAANSTLTVADDVVIDGRNFESSGSLFKVEQNANLYLSNDTLVNNVNKTGVGGAINNNGNVNILNSYIYGNSSSINDAIYNNGTGLSLQGNPYIDSDIYLTDTVLSGEGDLPTIYADNDPDADPSSLKFNPDSPIKVNIENPVKNRLVVDSADKNIFFNSDYFELNAQVSYSYVLVNDQANYYQLTLQEILTVYVDTTNAELGNGITPDTAYNNLLSAYESIASQEAGCGRIILVSPINVASNSTMTISRNSLVIGDTLSSFPNIKSLIFDRYAKPSEPIGYYTKESNTDSLFIVGDYASLNIERVTIGGHSEDVVSENKAFTSSGIHDAKPLVYANASSHLTIGTIGYSVTFENADCSQNGSVAYQNGGAIFADSNSDVAINYANFNNVKATNGGAIYTNGQVVIHPNTDNAEAVKINAAAATNYGGAIYVSNTGSLENYASTIINSNCTAENGSCVYLAGTWVAQGQYNISGEVYLANSNSANDIHVEYPTFYKNTGSITYNCEKALDGKLMIEDKYASSTHSYKLADNLSNNYEIRIRENSTTEYELHLHSPVYVDPTNGSDDNNGLKPSSAVASLVKAYEVANTEKSSYIYVVNPIVVDDGTLSVNSITCSYTSGSTSTQMSVDNPVSLVRYSKPTSAPEGFSVESNTGAIFSVLSGSLSIKNITIDGHSQAVTEGPITLISPAVDAMHPLIEVNSNTASITLSNGTVLTNNNNISSDVAGGALYINAGLEQSTQKANLLLMGLETSNTSSALDGDALWLSNVNTKILSANNFTDSDIYLNYTTLSMQTSDAPNGMDDEGNLYPVNITLDESNFAIDGLVVVQYGSIYAMPEDATEVYKVAHLDKHPETVYDADYTKKNTYLDKKYVINAAAFIDDEPDMFGYSAALFKDDIEIEQTTITNDGTFVFDDDSVQAGSYGYVKGDYTIKVKPSGISDYLFSLDIVHDSADTIHPLNAYTVSFDDDTENPPASQVVQLDGKVLSPVGKEKEGYTLESWNYTNQFGEDVAWDFDNDTVSATLELKANYVPNKYTVILNSEYEGTTDPGTTSVEATYGEILPEIVIPTNIQANFFGYYYHATAGDEGVMYYDSSGAPTKVWDIAANATLVAKFEAIDAVAQVITPSYTRLYANINEAFASCADSTQCTIQLLKDIDSCDTIDVTAKQTITLDLNGFDLGSSSQNISIIDCYGTLSIMDSSEDTSGAILGTYAYRSDDNQEKFGLINILDKGSVTLESGKIQGGFPFSINVASQLASFTMNGGSIEKGSSSAIANKAAISTTDALGSVILVTLNNGVIDFLGSNALLGSSNDTNARIKNTGAIVKGQVGSIDRSTQITDSSSVVTNINVGVVEGGWCSQEVYPYGATTQALSAGQKYAPLQQVEQQITVDGRTIYIATSPDPDATWTVSVPDSTINLYYKVGQNCTGSDIGYDDTNKILLPINSKQNKFMVLDSTTTGITGDSSAHYLFDCWSTNTATPTVKANEWLYYTGSEKTDDGKLGIVLTSVAVGEDITYTFVDSVADKHGTAKPADVTIPWTELVDLPATGFNPPSIDGSTFDGYFDGTADAATMIISPTLEQVVGFDTYPGATVTLYAHWHGGDIYDQTIVTFDKNTGASTDKDEKFTFQLNQNLPTLGDTDAPILPKWTGHTFEGYTDENGTTYFDASGQPQVDKWDKGFAEYTLTAHWSAIREGTWWTFTYGQTLSDVLQNVVDPGVTIDGNYLTGTFSLVDLPGDTILDVSDTPQNVNVVFTPDDGQTVGFTLTQVRCTIAFNVTPRTVAISWGALSKIYDGQTADFSEIASVSNSIEGDDVSLQFTNLDAKNAGTYTITVNGLSGDDSNNYQLPSSSTLSVTYVINQRPIYVNNVVIEDKVYDTLDTATIDFDEINFVNIVDGDTVSFTSVPTATFDDPNVGDDIGVTLKYSGCSINNYNYVLNSSDCQAKSSASITPYVVTNLSVKSDSGKVYDGTTDFYAFIDDVTYHDETIVFSDVKASFNDKNAGTNKPVTISTYKANISSKSKPQAYLSNYVLPQGSEISGAAADITKRDIYVVWSDINTFEYDHMPHIVECTLDESPGKDRIIAGDSVSVYASGEQINVGVWTASAAIENGDEPGFDGYNYKVNNSCATSTFTIGKAQLTQANIDNEFELQTDEFVHNGSQIKPSFKIYGVTYIDEHGDEVTEVITTGYTYEYGNNIDADVVDEDGNIISYGGSINVNFDNCNNYYVSDKADNSLLKEFSIKKKASETSDFNFSLPSGDISYDNEAHGIDLPTLKDQYLRDASSPAGEMTQVQSCGPINLVYINSTTSQQVDVPVNAGVYSVCLHIEGGRNFTSAVQRQALILGTITIAPITNGKVYFQFVPGEDNFDPYDGTEQSISDFNLVYNNSDLSITLTQQSDEEGSIGDYVYEWSNNINATTNEELLTLTLRPGDSGNFTFNNEPIVYTFDVSEYAIDQYKNGNTDAEPFELTMSEGDMYSDNLHIFKYEEGKSCGVTAVNLLEQYQTLDSQEDACGKIIVYYSKLNDSGAPVGELTTTLPTDKGMYAIYLDVEGGRNFAGKTGQQRILLQDKILISDLMPWTMLNFACKGESQLLGPWQYYLTAHDTDDSSTTVTLLRDIPCDDQSLGSISIDSGRNVVLDLNGCQVNRNIGSGQSAAIDKGSAITNKGNLTVIDSSDDQTGQICGGNNSTGAGGIVNVEGTTLTLKGGNITHNRGLNGSGVYVSNSNIYLEGGSIIDNYGTGLYLAADSGDSYDADIWPSVVIKNNRTDSLEASNLFIEQGKFITIIDPDADDDDDPNEVNNQNSDDDNEYSIENNTEDFEADGDDPESLPVCTIGVSSSGTPVQNSPIQFTTKDDASIKYYSCFFADNANQSVETIHGDKALYLDNFISVDKLDESGAVVGSSISGYNGQLTGDVVFPETANGKEVVAVAFGTFRNNTDIQSIQLQDYVESVEPGAFTGCTNLKHFYISEDNQKMRSDDGGPLLYQYKDIVDKEGKTRTIFDLVSYPSASGANTVVPSSVEGIESLVFENCDITQIKFEGSRPIFGGEEKGAVDVFKGISSLNYIYYPDPSWCDSDKPLLTNTDCWLPRLISQINIASYLESKYLTANVKGEVAIVEDSFTMPDGPNHYLAEGSKQIDFISAKDVSFGNNAFQLNSGATLNINGYSGATFSGHSMYQTNNVMLQSNNLNNSTVDQPLPSSEPFATNSNSNSLMLGDNIHPHEDVDPVADGVMFISGDGSTINISNMEFNGNLQTYSCVYCHNNSNVNITNCTFKYNSAAHANIDYAWGGSCIYNAGNCVINGCTFENNSAAYCGGAINNIGNLSLNGCTFTKNKAYFGGAIYNSSDGARLFGKIILSDYGSKPTIITENSCISKGRRASGGGVLMLNGSDVLLNGTIKIVNNTNFDEFAENFTVGKLYNNKMITFSFGPNFVPSLSSIGVFVEYHQRPTYQISNSFADQPYKESAMLAFSADSPEFILEEHNGCMYYNSKFE